MRVPSPMRIAALTLLVGGLACAKNMSDRTVGAARDTTALDTMARDTTTLDTMARDTTARDTAGVPEAIDSSAIYRDLGGRIEVLVERVVM